MRYDPKKIEAKWQRKWLAAKTYEPDFKRAKKPFYNLMMFPYPSAEGLHVGNMYAFTGSDIYGRFKRMQGYDVFEPIGLDGFGIHSENYALKTKRHPMTWAKISEKNFYRQLQMIGCGFSWGERLETYDQEYYQWTQWIFIQMFKRGLAYRKKQAVNWCPSCKTVLADEQVIAGKCERCESVVIKKELEQWFFRITKYADRLLKNLEKLDWSERVKIAQKEWIGKSEGALIPFLLKSDFNSIEVFTTRPDTLFGVTFLAISPDLAKKWLDVGWQTSQEVKDFIAAELSRRAKPKSDDEGEREKGGVATGVAGINPANGEKIPVWVVNYVLGDVGTGAIMAVPAHDQRDFEFAKKHNLPLHYVVAPSGISVSRSRTGVHWTSDQRVFTGEGVLYDSDKFTGMDSEEAKWAITKFVRGKKVIQYHLRDWLISRQRYWGPPIPMIFCENCAKSTSRSRTSDGSPTSAGWIPVPEKDLPVKLPPIKKFRPTGTDQSPLAGVEKFYKVRCPACKSWARRETDVSDTFLDSAWYFLRYPSVKNKRAAWNPAITKKWLPVSRYMGGAEHSVLHLLYVRFLAMALHDAGLVHFDEPMPSFRAHGLLIKDGAKMSKSKGNVVNPDEYIRAYGADALRMYLMFLAPWEQGGDFRDAGIRGITRFLERVWRFANEKMKNKNEKRQSKIQKDGLTRAVHQTVKKVTEDIEHLQYNTAISALMVLLNAFEEQRDAVSKKDRETFLKLLAPFAPCITEELWQSKFQSPIQSGTRSKFRSIHLEPWPDYDSRLIARDIYELVIQINGKVRGRVALAIGTSQENASRIARGVATVAPYLSVEPKKIIFIPNKLINFVT